jgi:hypothetical protein
MSHPLRSGESLTNSQLDIMITDAQKTNAKRRLPKVPDPAGSGSMLGVERGDSQGRVRAAVSVREKPLRAPTFLRASLRRNSGWAVGVAQMRQSKMLQPRASVFRDEQRQHDGRRQEGSAARVARERSRQADRGSGFKDTLLIGSVISTGAADGRLFANNQERENR